MLIKIYPVINNDNFAVKPFFSSIPTEIILAGRGLVGGMNEWINGCYDRVISAGNELVNNDRKKKFEDKTEGRIFDYLKYFYSLLRQLL